MKLTRLSATILTTEDTPMPISETNSAAFTVRKALINSCVADGEANATTKMARYDLYKKLKRGDDIFDIEAVKLLKDSVLLAYGTLIAGQVIDNLEDEGTTAA